VGGAPLEADGDGGAAVAEGACGGEDAPLRLLGDLGSVVERAGGRGDAHARLGGHIADRDLHLPRPAAHPPPRAPSPEPVPAAPLGGPRASKVRAGNVSGIVARVRGGVGVASSEPYKAPGAGAAAQGAWR